MSVTLAIFSLSEKMPCNKDSSKISFSGAVNSLTPPEKCLYSEFFWSVFSCIQTEHGAIQHISSVLSLNAGKYGPEKPRIRTLFMQYKTTSNYYGLISSIPELFLDLREKKVSFTSLIVLVFYCLWSQYNFQKNILMIPFSLPALNQFLQKSYENRLLFPLCQEHFFL